MQNIKITVAYDGAAFHGWQFQPGDLQTIQGTLQEALRKITQERIMIHGASRTDAGVHAFGQVAHFKTHSNLTAQELKRAMNALMPPTVRVVDASEIGQDFHSRWMAQAKTYRYRIHRQRVLSPFEYGRVLHYPWELNEVAMNEAARLFEGEHDFTSFAASTGSEEDDKDRDMMRVIYSSEIVRDPAACEIAYVVRGKSFLRYMVRKIVGTLLEVGKGKLTPADIPRLFEARDRSLSGPTVQPQGLYLMSLEYPDPANSWATFKAQRPPRNPR